MASKPPKGAQQEEVDNSRLNQTIMPKIGLADEVSKGSLVPFEFVGPIIEARVGQMKAEMEREFADKLAKIDNLPTKWQLLGGGASGIIVTLALLFGIAAYFGDRQDNAVDRSASVSSALTRIESRMNAQQSESKEQQGNAPKSK